MFSIKTILDGPVIPDPRSKRRNDALGRNYYRATITSLISPLVSNCLEKQRDGWIPTQRRLNSQHQQTPESFCIRQLQEMFRIMSQQRVHNFIVTLATRDNCLSVMARETRCKKPLPCSTGVSAQSLQDRSRPNARHRALN